MTISTGQFSSNPRHGVCVFRILADPGRTTTCKVVHLTLRMGEGPRQPHTVDTKSNDINTDPAHGEAALSHVCCCQHHPHDSFYCLRSTCLDFALACGVFMRRIRGPIVECSMLANKDITRKPIGSTIVIPPLVSELQASCM
jgi:hypothetical protein